MLFIMCLMACNEPITSARVKDDLTTAPDSSYGSEGEKPRIFIDQYGYGKKDKKYLYIEAGNIDQNFEIRDAATEKTVYRGELKKVNSSEACNFYWGDFSELQIEGTYFVFQDTVGKSFEFKVADDLYEQLFYTYYDLLKQNPPKSTSRKADCLSTVLMSKELFPVVSVDDHFIKTLVNEMIEENENSFLEKAEESKITAVEAAKMSGILAHVAYLYNSEDIELSRRCREVSENAFQYFEKQIEIIPSDLIYYASAELYRITGYHKYKKMIQQYDQIPKEDRQLTEFNYTIWGDVVYLSTSYKVNYNRCDLLFKKYLKQAQDITGNARRQHFYVDENIKSITKEKLLEQMIIVGIINDSLSGRAFEMAQKNYIHYFMGENPEHKNIIQNEEWMNQLESEEISQMLFIIASICKEKEADK